MTPTINEESSNRNYLENESYTEATSREHTPIKSPFRIIKNISPSSIIVKGELHEMEPLMSPTSMKKPVITSKSTSPLFPNGFLIRSNNNGNPNLNGSQC